MRWGVVLSAAFAFALAFRVLPGIAALPKHSWTAPSDDYVGCAIVTMASGDLAARHAVALVQSLRDVNTRVPNIVVMLPKGGLGSSECKKRDPKACPLSSQMDDIVSPRYQEALRSLGATLRVVDAIPSTRFTDQIPGGPTMFWGMALNKLRVFELVEFRKVIYLDSDVLAMQNIDHLFLEPDFTAGFTNDGCNKGAPTKISGGLWVFTPSLERFQEVVNITRNELPEGGNWRLGDMEVIMAMFGEFRTKKDGTRWPLSKDSRQGRVPKLHLMEELWSKGDPSRIGTMPPASMSVEKEAAARKAGKTVWNMLDVRYDGLVGECVCFPERDLGLSRLAAVEIGLAEGMPNSRWHVDGGTVAKLPVKVARSKVDNTAEGSIHVQSGWDEHPKEKKPWSPTLRADGFSDGFFTIHFSCLPVGLNKPAKYKTEETLIDTLHKFPPCLRQYFMLWYSKFKRGMAGEGFSDPVQPDKFLDLLGPPFVLERRSNA